MDRPRLVQNLSCLIRHVDAIVVADEVEFQPVNKIVLPCLQAIDGERPRSTRVHPDANALAGLEHDGLVVFREEWMRRTILNRKLKRAGLVRHACASNLRIAT